MLKAISKKAKNEWEVVSVTESLITMKNAKGKVKQLSPEVADRYYDLVEEKDEIVVVEEPSVERILPTNRQYHKLVRYQADYKISIDIKKHLSAPNPREAFGEVIANIMQYEKAGKLKKREVSLRTEVIRNHFNKIMGYNVLASLY